MVRIFSKPHSDNSFYFTFAVAIRCLEVIFDKAVSMPLTIMTRSPGIGCPEPGTEVFSTASSSSSAVIFFCPNCVSCSREIQNILKKKFKKNFPKNYWVLFLFRFLRNETNVFWLQGELFTQWGKVANDNRVCN